MTKSSVIRATIAAAVFSTTSAAFAADIILPEEPIPVVTPIFTWTGVYIGLVGGYNWGKGDWSVAGENIVSLDPNGWNIGGTVGYNYQFTNSVVLGIETDLSWSGAEDSVFCDGEDFRCETKSDWFGTLRPRLGYAFDRFLPYITGGAAYGSLKLRARDTDTGESFSDSTTRFGWAAGVGMEYAFTDNFTGKLEYLHTDLGDDNFLIGDTIVRGDWSADGVRVGLNYKF